MRVKYDASVNAAYIYLVEEFPVDGVARTVSVDPREIDGMINLDFDSNGALIGIEVLDASHFLHPELLK